MSEFETTLAEQSVLFAHEEGDPQWSHRFSSDNSPAQLGDKFTVNALVTPRSSPFTTMVSPEALEASGKWLANTLLKRSDTLLRHCPVEGRLLSGNASSAGELHVEEAEGVLGFNLAGLPQPYQEWRFAIECYFLLGDSLYVLLDGFLLRYKTLTERELGQALGPRLLPFLGRHDHDLEGAMLFLVGCPVRLGALGGLRGYRRTFLEAGRAAVQLQQAAANEAAQWHFETEFYDDAAAEVLSVDGVERIPLIIGYRFNRTCQKLEESNDG